MTVHSWQQGSAPPPPIPALPTTPGAATGAGTSPNATQLRQEIQQAVRDVRDAAREARQNGVPAGVVIAPGGGQAGTTIQTLPFDPNNMIPPEVVPLTAMTLAMIAVIFIGWPIARAFGRRMDRRTELVAVKAADIQPQIRQLQESVDAMAIELERIGEAQRFTAKLMSERAMALPASRESAG
jgi:hypothetical protein